MFNLFKKRITANEIVKECISTFAEIIYALEDRTVRDRWLKTDDIDNVRTLVDDGVIEMFIRKNFKSDEFNQKFKKLDEFELGLVKMGILRASVSMKEFIDRRIRIWMHQEEIRRTEPKMRVSWDFPEYDQYPQGFYSVKMLFLGHFPDD